MTWHNAPRHICKDAVPETPKGLAFCCPKEKLCIPRDACLKKFGISGEGFTEMKESFRKEFENNEDVDVCFRSLVWCCKMSRACPRRDKAMEKLKLTPEKYMLLKKKMAEEFENKNI